MMIGPAVMYSATTALTFVVGMLLMLSIDARLTLIALLPLPLISVAVKHFGTVIHRRFERIQAQLSEISAMTQETLSGVRVVRAYGQEAFEAERFRRANQEHGAEPRPHPDPIALLPNHGSAHGGRRTARPVAREPGGGRRTHDRG